MGLKIRKVKFLNEVQFGDLELDFLNSQTDDSAVSVPHVAL